MFHIYCRGFLCVIICIICTLLNFQAIKGQMHQHDDLGSKCAYMCHLSNKTTRKSVLLSIPEHFSEIKKTLVAKQLLACACTKTKTYKIRLHLYYLVYGIWNSLSLNMKMAPSLSSFKKLYLEEQFSTLWPQA